MEMGNEQGKRRPTEWSYDLKRVAELSGNSIHTVRDHVVQGLLMPDNLLNVLEYIQSSRTFNSLRVTGSVFNDTDAYGNVIRT